MVSKAFAFDHHVIQKKLPIDLLWLRRSCPFRKRRSLRKKPSFFAPGPSSREIFEKLRWLAGFF